MYTYIVYLHIFTFRTWNNMFKKIWLFPYGSDQSLHQETWREPTIATPLRICHGPPPLSSPSVRKSGRTAQSLDS